MAKVVLAEDDETMVRLLGTLLRMDGYDVTEADGESDLVSVVEQVVPDAVVLDMVLGDQNGLEVVEHLRASAVGAKIYILMISGLNVCDECLQRGANDFLLKPFMPEELTGLLREHIQSPA